MVIVITGTPGTGKTTYARKLGEKRNKKVISVTQLLKQADAFEEFDEDTQSFVVDDNRLVDELVSCANKYPDCILEGHLAHELPATFVDTCIVMKCDLSTLKKRLENRGYSHKKVRENLDCEIFDICYVEAVENGHEVEIMYSSK